MSNKSTNIRGELWNSTFTRQSILAIWKLCGKKGLRISHDNFSVLFSWILIYEFLNDKYYKWSVPSLKNDSPMTLTSKPESVRARLLWETLQSKDGPFKKTLNVAVRLASLAAIFDHLLDVMGWIVSPLNSCVQVLPLPLRHDFIWNVILYSLKKRKKGKKKISLHWSFLKIKI